SEQPFTAEETETDSSTATESSVTKPKTVKQHVEHYLEKAKQAGSWTLQNPTIVLLLLCFWLYMMGEQTEILLMIQYATTNISSLTQASLLPSLGALVNLLTLTLLLPYLSILFSPFSPSSRFRGMSEPAKDSLLAKIFATLLTLGCFLIALPLPPSGAAGLGFLASGEVLYSAGAALSVPLRSLITNLVDARHRGTLYTVISV
ncbi:hypothetical protein N0V85_009844, partial [Neurospora sp. IMI 360204]